ncbi:MAG: regulator of replication initiation timing [Alphaproteobacteria bacterium]|jgi:regulator of replication initiation timing
MDSAKRLEQAVEKLESFMQLNAEISALNGKDGEKISKLLEENKSLKSKQDQIKKRLDTLIKKAETEG